MSSVRVARAVMFCLLLALIAAGLVFLWTHPEGQKLLHHPRAMGVEFKGWVKAHHLLAPLAYVALFIAMTVLAMPVLWLELLGGFGFGLVLGVLWTQIGATIGATLAAILTRWLAAEWFHRKVESRLARLRELDEKMGHNGLLVVMLVRLAHFLPFGVSNYVFGLSTISAIDVAVGTAVGGIPSVAISVALGADWHLREHWQFWAAIASINALMLVPLVLRYLRPEWFQRVGIK